MTLMMLCNSYAVERPDDEESIGFDREVYDLSLLLVSLCKTQKWLPPYGRIDTRDNVKSSCQRKQISKSRFAKCISVFINRTAGAPVAVVNISLSHILTSNCYIVTIALYNLCSIVFVLFIRIYPCLQNA